MIWFVRKGRPDCLSLLSYLILLLVCMFFRVCFLLLCFLVFDFGKFVHVFFAVSFYIPVSVPSPGSFLWFNFCLPLSSRFLSYRVLLPSDMYSLGFFILLLAWFGFCFLFLIKVVFVFVVFVSLFYSLSFFLCLFLFVVILAAIFLSMSRHDNYALRGWLGVKNQSPIYLSSFPLLSLRPSLVNIISGRHRQTDRQPASTGPTLQCIPPLSPAPCVTNWPEVQIGCRCPLFDHRHHRRRRYLCSRARNPCTAISVGMLSPA